MNKSIVISIILFTLLAVGGGVWYISANQTQPPTNLDPFAQCLSSKQFTMYGAYWCPHCADQKKLFGSAFKSVPYVECTVEAKLCAEKGVQGYPTWISGEGKSYSGVLSLQQISELSSCQLPN